MSWADPPVSRSRGSGAAVSLGPGVLSPPLPPPRALASELTFSQFHQLSGLWGGRNRSARPCSSLPVWGLSPQTPPNPLAASIPAATRTPAESLTSQGVLGWKVSPSCKCCACEPGSAQSKPGSPVTDPSGPRAGRAHTCPGTSAHPLRLGAPGCYLSASSAAPGPPPMEAGAVFYVFYVFRAPSKTESYSEGGVSSSSSLILFTKERETGAALCQVLDGSGDPSCLPPASLWGASDMRDRTGAPRSAPRSRNPPEGSQWTDVKRVRPANKGTSAPGAATAQGGSPGRQPRFRSDTHDLDFRATCEPRCPRARGPGAVSLRGNQPLPSPLRVRNCKPCAFGAAFCNFLYMVKGGKP